MNSEFVDAFIEALSSVFGTMIGVDVSPQQEIAKDSSLSLGEVSGIIAMATDKVQGSFSISLESSIALECMWRLFGERPDSINDEIADLVGELTNMVAGVAKAALETKGYDFGMATPKMLTGESHLLEHQALNKAVLVIPFISDSGMIYLELSLDD